MESSSITKAISATKTKTRLGARHPVVEVFDQRGRSTDVDGGVCATGAASAAVSRIQLMVLRARHVFGIHRQHGGQQGAAVVVGECRGAAPTRCWATPASLLIASIDLLRARRLTRRRRGRPPAPESVRARPAPAPGRRGDAAADLVRRLELALHAVRQHHRQRRRRQREQYQPTPPAPMPRASASPRRSSASRMATGSIPARRDQCSNQRPFGGGPAERRQHRGRQRGRRQHRDRDRQDRAGGHRRQSRGVDQVDAGDRRNDGQARTTPLPGRRWPSRRRWPVSRLARPAVPRGSASG